MVRSILEGFWGVRPPKALAISSEEYPSISRKQILLPWGESPEGSLIGLPILGSTGHTLGPPLPPGWLRGWGFFSQLGFVPRYINPGV